MEWFLVCDLGELAQFWRDLPREELTHESELDNSGRRPFYRYSLPFGNGSWRDVVFSFGAHLG